MAPDASLAVRPVAAPSYDGELAAAIASRLGVPAVSLYAVVGSTMDLAHGLGEAGAPAGTLVLTDAQAAGRGRHGSVWRSEPGRGVWLTLLERPTDSRALPVLSLRVGLAAAGALDRFAAESVRLKWPNDLFVGAGKVAGVLVETRWRGARPDWVAIGLGVNVVAPAEVPGAVGLRSGVSRLEVLESLVPAVRTAAAANGLLDAREVAEFAVRDVARGRRCRSPCPGIVSGVTATGELAVETPFGLRHYRSGSLVLQEGA